MTVHRLIFPLIFLLIFGAAYGQINYSGLINSALSGENALFVRENPIQHIGIDSNKMWMYYRLYHNKNQKLVLDTEKLFEIIGNSPFSDTRKWDSSDLPTFILVSGNNSILAESKTLLRLIRINPDLKEYYKKQVEDFNNAREEYKTIYNISRPIFDNSRLFAIVEWTTRENGAIVLCHFQDKVWKKEGTIRYWDY